MCLYFQRISFSSFNAKKNVSRVQLYLAQDSNGVQFIEKTRTKQSYLRVSFGLKHPRRSPQFRQRDHFGVRPLDSGGFSLKWELGSKSILTIIPRFPSPNFVKERPGNGGKICSLASKPDRVPRFQQSRQSFAGRHSFDRRVGRRCAASDQMQRRIQGRPGSRCSNRNEAHCGGRESRQGTMAPINDGDVVYLGDGQYLRCHFSEGIIEEERNVINTLQGSGISLTPTNAELMALDGITFSAQRGEMLCILGPSGCGKSTLLRTIAGSTSKPNDGSASISMESIFIPSWRISVPILPSFPRTRLLIPFSRWRKTSTLRPRSAPLILPEKRAPPPRPTPA